MGGRDIDDYMGIDWKDQVQNGGGCFTIGSEDFEQSSEAFINLDDALFGVDHDVSEFVSDGRRSLVFHPQLLQEIKPCLKNIGGFLEDAVNVTSDGGVKKKVRKTGNGISPPENAQVWIHYQGFFEGQVQPFDSTQENGRMHTFRLRSELGEVLLGLELAIRSMEFGEVAVVLINNSNYAYGQYGHPPRIPPASKVLFLVELLDFKVSYKPTIFLMDPETRDKLPFEEILGEAKRLQGVGKVKFVAEDYDGSLQSYKIAYTLLEDFKTRDNSEITLMKELQYFLVSNMAECHLRLDDFEAVCEVSQHAQEIQLPMKNAKLLVRHAKALQKLNRISEALHILDEAMKIEPGHSTISYLKKLAQKKLEIDQKHRDDLDARIMRGYLERSDKVRDDEQNQRNTFD